MIPTLLELLLLGSLAALAWNYWLADLILTPEVRRLRRMRKALKAQLAAKREVLKLRKELGDLQAELDAQEQVEMLRLEEMISSIGRGDRPAFGSEGQGPPTAKGDPPTPDRRPLEHEGET